MHIKKTASTFLFSLLLATGTFATESAPQQPPEKAAVEKVEPSPSITPAAPSNLEQPAAPLPSSHEMTSSYESAFIKMFATLLGLVVLILAAFWVLRRLGKGRFSLGSSKTIAIIERKPLSPKSMLYLVEYDNKRILISESQLEVRVLSSIEEPMPEED
ncbi:MAG: flagellar biosynthetic protein FliO [Chlamydiota bacterium]